MKTPASSFIETTYYVRIDHEFHPSKDNCVRLRKEEEVYLKIIDYLSKVKKDRGRCMLYDYSTDNASPMSYPYVEFRSVSNAVAEEVTKEVLKILRRHRMTPLADNTSYLLDT